MKKDVSDIPAIDAERLKHEKDGIYVKKDGRLYLQWGNEKVGQLARKIIK